MKSGAPTGNIEVTIVNNSDRMVKVKITDHSYKRNNHQQSIGSRGKTNISLNLNESHGWYDFALSIDGINPFIKRYAGRVENGKETITDPVMGGIVT
jgi:phospholipase C